MNDNDPPKPPVYQRILGIDIGQTYLAVSKFVWRDGKYLLTNLGIHEFAKGSSTHQPIYFTSEAEAKCVNEYSKSKETTEKKKAKKIVKAVAPQRRPELPEIRLFESVAQVICDYVRIWMPNMIFIEDQLPEAKRNRLVEGAIAAACVALSVERVYVAPMSKFDFESKYMKELANRLLEKAIRMNSSPELKIAALRLCKETIWSKEYHRGRPKNENGAEIEDDFDHVDRDSLHDVGNRSIAKLNAFYEKDLADAFLIGLRGITYLIKREREMEEIEKKKVEELKEKGEME